MTLACLHVLGLSWSYSFPVFSFGVGPAAHVQQIHLSDMQADTVDTGEKPRIR